MPLFTPFKKNKKKTKDQLSSASAEGVDGNDHDDKDSTNPASGSSVGATATAKPASNTTTATTSSANQTPNKAKSDKSPPVRTVSQKAPNPFSSAPVNIPKSSTLGVPSDLDSSRMYSTSPLSTSTSQPPPIGTSNPQQQQQQQPSQQSHLQNVVTGQYNAPPTPPSTARSGSIDDKIDSLATNNSQSFQQRQHDQQQQLKQPQSQQSYHKYSDITTSDSMSSSSSGLLTPVSSASGITSRFPASHASATMRVTKGKYSITDFTILRTLGTGSFGRVHLVQSRHNSRFYAVKVLKKQQVVKMKQVEHTNDERAMLQIVKHPFLVNLWGTFQDSKNLYMVMDFIEGGELFSLLRKSQRFPNPVAKFYAAEVALAINYLHSLDIIYRDLKPENLLLDRYGHVKITDFGFAKKVPDITWTLCGTPDYLAPEVVASKGYNKSVDWWSLGILTYEMLAGYPPFYDQNPMKLYENIMSGRVKYPSYFDSQVKDLLSKLLTSDLTKRYGNLKAGSADIFNHHWFSEVNWERLERREIDAPYVPPIRPGGGDASQFERYDEETEEYGDFSSKDLYGYLFTDF